MKALFRYFGVLAIWLMAMFLAQRLLFLSFSHLHLVGIPEREIFQCHLHALPMDLSATGYILLVASALSVPLLFTERKWLRRTVRIFLVVVVVLSALINVTDIGLFDAWGTKLDRKALSYLAYPDEVLGATTFMRMAMLLYVAAIQSMVFIVLLKRIDHQRNYTSGGRAGRVLSALLIPALCILAARGGPQDLPIDKSWSWFSRHQALNLAALNPVWNVMELAVEPAEIHQNPYVALPAEEAAARFSAQHPGGIGTSTSITRTPRPNVLLIMLESWTAGVIEPLGGDTGVTPQFSRLCNDGLLFTNFYSTGFRTEQGLCALLSAFPSQPTTTIIRKFGKFDQLPSLVNTLDSAGYTSRYYYAGDVSFANTRAYLDAMGFDAVYDEHSFPIKQRTRWGAFDEELFDFHLRDAKSSPRPFFQIIMTSTSHEPFDAPVHEGFEGSEPQMYRNTVHYTDRQLGHFIDEAKKQDWYANTLIFIVADHGHYLPHNLPQYCDARHRIPFLVTGGALRDEFHGKRNATSGSHVDLAATLLGQLGLAHERFTWSNNLFDASLPHAAFWSFNDGFGIADSTQSIVFDETGKRVIELRDSSDTKNADRLLLLGKAQLQTLVDRYIAFDQ